jgi:transcriptional regulator with XRE-family HTH domain
MLADMISPLQCRAARSILRLSLAQLAAKCRISSPTLSKFENEASSPLPAILAAIESTLLAHGIIFVDNSEGVGALLKKK